MRLRDLGIRIGDLSPGPRNAITDVAGVRVGHSTVVSGSHQSPGAVVRTGVTLIDPRPGSVRENPCYAGASSFNGNGECTGLEWIRESGLLTSRIALTGTHAVGAVHHALAAGDLTARHRHAFWSMPVVAETYDGILSDPGGQHIGPEHVVQAIENLGAEVAEGAVGGGTGMVCHQFKGGIGTSSRALPAEDGGWTVGVLVQSNYGFRHELRVDGWPVGRILGPDVVPLPSARPAVDKVTDQHPAAPPGAGSIIVVIATDAPLLGDQCRRLAARAGVGLARAGGGTGDDSGDIFLAFATGNHTAPAEYYDGHTPTQHALSAVPHQRLRPLFEAAADATEEAIVNSLLAAPTMTGHGGNTAHALEGPMLLDAIESSRSRR